MVCSICPLCPHRSRLGRKVGSHDAPSVTQLFTFFLGGRVLHGEDRKWSKKIGKKHRKPIVCPICGPIVPTQVTLRGNVCSLDAPSGSQLFTFGPRLQGIALKGLWS